MKYSNKIVAIHAIVAMVLGCPDIEKLLNT